MSFKNQEFTPGVGEATVEQELSQEIRLPGGAFRFAIETPSRSGLLKVGAARFVNHNGSAFRDILQLFPGRTPIEVAPSLKDAYQLPDEEEQREEKITLSELTTERGVRTLLHEGGHFKQFHEPVGQAILLIQKDFTQAVTTRQPLETLFEIAERLVTLVPSLQGELAKVKQKYEVEDRALLEPPAVNPEVLEKQHELKQKRRELRALEQERTVEQRQVARLCVENLSKHVSSDNLGQVKSMLDVCERVASGTSNEFHLLEGEGACGGVVIPEEKRMEFVFMQGSKLAGTFDLVFDGTLGERFVASAVRVETIRQRQVQLQHELPRIQKRLNQIEETFLELLEHRYFQILGSPAGDLPFDEERGTLSNFLRYTVLLLERDATERALEWMTQLRDELGIDLLSHEADDWHLTLECLGTYGANSSQLLDKLGFIPQFERAQVEPT